MHVKLSRLLGMPDSKKNQVVVSMVNRPLMARQHGKRSYNEQWLEESCSISGKLCSALPT